MSTGLEACVAIRHAAGRQEISLTCSLSSSLASSHALAKRRRRRHHDPSASGTFTPALSPRYRLQMSAEPSRRHRLQTPHSTIHTQRYPHRRLHLRPQRQHASLRWGKSQLFLSLPNGPEKQQNVDVRSNCGKNPITQAKFMWEESRKLKSWDTVPFLLNIRISGLSPFIHGMLNNVSSDIPALNIRIFQALYLRIFKHLIRQYFSVCNMLIPNIQSMMMI